MVVGVTCVLSVGFVFHVKVVVVMSVSFNRLVRNASTAATNAKVFAITVMMTIATVSNAVKILPIFQTRLLIC